MKQLFFYIAAISLTLIACKKTGSASTGSASLDGTWRMVLVKENSSGLVTTKPSSIQGDVDIAFTTVNFAAGFLRGNTPTNDISQSDYSVGTNQSLAIPNLNMTKVTETSWGKEFVDNIRSSQEYGFETDGKLTIKTASKTLTFIKL
jgi:hypothetical protein